MTGYVDAQDAHRVAAQVVRAGRHLASTGFPQDERGAAALRARALAQVLEAIADEAKAAGLTEDGQVPADVQMLSQLRSLVDQTVSSLVLHGHG